MANHGLYKALLRQILYPAGVCSSGWEIEQVAMLSYIQEAFKVSNDNHLPLLLEAQKMGPPELKLKVELVEVKGLVPKYSKLSEVSVTIYLTSDSDPPCRASANSSANKHAWGKPFLLTLPVNFQDVSLCFEVGGLYNDAPGVNVFRSPLKKERLIGTANVSLKSIPASGTTMYFNLLLKTKKTPLRYQGELTVRLNFSANKSQGGSHERRELIKTILTHERNSQAGPCWPSWVRNPAENILTLNMVHSGLSATDDALAQWSVYCTNTVDIPIDFAIFNKLLEVITKPLQSGVVEKEDVTLFWNGATIILPICLEQIRKLQNQSEKVTVREILKILQAFSNIDVPETVELFPINKNGFERHHGEMLPLYRVLEQVVKQGASNWLDEIWAKDESDTEMDQLKYIVKVILLVNSNLEQAIKYHENVFQEVMNFPYTAVLYEFYDSKITSLAEPAIQKVGERLKSLICLQTTNIPNQGDIEDDLWAAISELRSAFERFFQLGSNLGRSDLNFCAATKFLPIFLDNEAYKMLKYIKKAVEFDKLTAIPSNKISSSEEDIVTILKEIMNGFRKWTWPDAQQAHTFTIKIIDVILRLCLFYGDHMCSLVSSICQTASEKFTVTSQCCVAINNVEGVSKIFNELYRELSKDEETPRRKETLPSNAEKSSSKNVFTSKIHDMLKICVEKMMPHVKQDLEALHSRNKSIDDVMDYLNTNLGTMHKHLTKDNFILTFKVLWEFLIIIIYDVIDTNKKRRPPAFFSELYKCFKAMTVNLRCDGYVPNPKNLEKILKLYAMDTGELIHQYNLERSQQQTNSESKFGILTVRLQFTEKNKLRVEILNCSGLLAKDSKRQCDSYVCVHLLPMEKFKNVRKCKTQKQEKTCYPLYDETFFIELSDQQRQAEDGLIHFVVKDQDLLGVQFIGEAYIKLCDVPDAPEPIKEQRKLSLTRPEAIDKDIIKVLKLRLDNEAAKKIVHRLTRKKLQ